METNNKQDARVTILVQGSTKAKLEAMAYAEGRTLSSQVRFLIEKLLNER